MCPRFATEVIKKRRLLDIDEAYMYVDFIFTYLYIVDLVLGFLWRKLSLKFFTL